MRRSILGCAVLGTWIASTAVLAYDQYSQNKDATNCRACHGDFRSSPYTSLVDGQSWGDDLHDVHRNTMLGGDCSTCHFSTRFPVLLDSSAGGTGLQAISCTGCHGRAQDATSGTQGAGAGLRQRHYRAGRTVCVDCHADSNPASKTVAGEDVLPPYYASPGTGHSIPTDSCNPAPAFPENYAGTTIGLDNDGDGAFDQADPDCAVAVVCGDGAVGAGEQCDDGNTVGGDCCSATCQFEAAGSTCSDGLFCIAGETCNGSGTCGGGSARSCDDGIACTADSCNETTDACVNAPSDAFCDDGLFCNGAESCSPATGCLSGAAPSCADADICTDDACNEGADRCDNVFDPTNDPTCAALVCGDGAIDPGEQCDDGNTANGDCCSATCRYESAGSSCDDGLFCNTGETCSGSGACGGGAPRSCDDGIGCTSDSCNETTDACVNAPGDAVCDDGLFCNGAEACSATADCQSGTVPDCSDADICTDDACNEGADLCDHVFDPTNDPTCVVTACGNGRVEPGEQCDDGNTVGADCCSATCQYESAGSSCDDGLFCNSGETCNGSGGCGGGSPRSCSDGIACTGDSCDEASDACLNAPSDAACDDGSFCNGAETCNATADCQTGTAPSCADADICTDDGCNEVADRCDNPFDPTNDPTCAALVCGDGAIDPGEQCDDGNTAAGDCCSATCQFESAGSTCSDGLFCTAGDACNGGGSCGGGSPRSCDDGIACTSDSCDETTDACVNASSDAACDDGLFCNGAEACSATAGCRSGATPSCADADICTDDACNEGADRCDHAFDPTNDPTCAALCPDADSDGFSAQGGNCGSRDCDDADDTVFPGATESCSDDQDDDCDGLIDAADDACAGTPWSVRRGTLQNPEYAGSPACASCHATQYAAWSGSLHARMQIRPGDAQAAGFPLPDDQSVPGLPVSVTSWSDVLFVIGQKWRTLYVDREGLLQPVQWNFAGGNWNPHPGGPYTCGACHTTGYDPAATFTTGGGQIVPGIEGAWVEYSIGCEACHGPGAAHAAAPAKDNINRITLDWTATGEGIRTPAIRSAEVCGNCHYRTARSAGPDPQRLSESQYNDWTASPHGSSLEFTTLNTYCAKCHSPGNATADSEEHYFSYFDPQDATQVACVSCHDPHRSSDDRWDTLTWPDGGRQQPHDHPAAIARYRGTDGDATTSDYAPFDAGASNALCTDCHTAQPGFRSHVDASPPVVVELHPPRNLGQPFTVPHAEHVEQGNAECVSCHMPTTRRSVNPDDVRAHTALPNEWGIGGTVHFDTTCGQCHQQAQDCVWCHAEDAADVEQRPASRPRLGERRHTRRGDGRFGSGK